MSSFTAPEASHADAPLLTQCSSKSWSNERVQELYRVLEA